MNNFLTLTTLLVATAANIVSAKNVCYLPKEVGPCRAAIGSWYYNKDTKQCEKFIYGGCQGNGNRFATQQGCELTCGHKDVCKLPPETGRCRGYFPSWYYDFKAKACKEFIYGGCGGNMNRFPSKEECENGCGCNKGIVQCENDPCDGAVCADKDAICVPDYCGGCNTKWYKSEQVKQCGTEGEPQDCVSTIRCPADPCVVNKCEKDPEAFCVANYCGGCNHYWYTYKRVPSCDTKGK